MVEFVGLSGPIKFDTSGLRTQFSLEMMELHMEGLVYILSDSRYFISCPGQYWYLEQFGQTQPFKSGD